MGNKWGLPLFRHMGMPALGGHSGRALCIVALTVAIERLFFHANMSRGFSNIGCKESPMVTEMNVCPSSQKQSQQFLGSILVSLTQAALISALNEPCFAISEVTI